MIKNIVITLKLSNIKEFKIKAWVILLFLITPWFWQLQLPKDLLNTHITQDISESRKNVDWKRGKIKEAPFNFIFLNWPSEFLSGRLQAVMENLSIENYFFSGHPRERVDIEEKQKFSPFQLILFIIGLFNPRIKRYGKRLLVYFLVVLFLSAIFKWRSFSQTILFAPFFIFIMALGLEKIYLILKWRKL